jgi:hypothetical protein
VLHFILKLAVEALRLDPFLPHSPLPSKKVIPMPAPKLENQIDESVETYPDSAILEYMEHQAGLFEQMRAQLVAQYLGQYILFEDGQVLDADEDHAVLVLRTYEKTGLRPLFVRRVLEAEPQLGVRTPVLPS